MGLYDVIRQEVIVVGPEGRELEQHLQFRSSDESVAVMSPRGFVFGVGAGTAVITATAGDVSASMPVVVIDPEGGAPRSRQEASAPKPNASNRSAEARAHLVVEGFTSADIERTLAAAAARGQPTTVYFPAGEYRIESSVRVPASDITLRGAGRFATWFVTSEGYASGAASVPTLEVTAVHRVRVEEIGFRYERDRIANEYGDPWVIAILGSDDSIVHRCCFFSGYSANWHVFIGMHEGRPSRRCGVTECYGERSEGHGIELNNVQDCFVERCIIRRSLHNAVEPYHRFGSFLEGTKVRDNLLIEAGTSGVSMHSDHRSDVSGNVIRDCGRYGIVLSTGREPLRPSSGGLCELNDVRRPGRLHPEYAAGIQTGNAVGWTVRRNVVEGSSWFGLAIGGRDHVVEENLSRSNDLWGMYVYGRGHRIVGNDCSDNVERSDAAGSFSAIFSEAEHVDIRGNVAEDSRATKRHRHHYEVVGVRTRFVENRGGAGTTTTGIAALVTGKDSVVAGNQDVPDMML